MTMLVRDLFPSGFPTKTFYARTLSHACYMPRPSHTISIHLPNNIRRGVQINKLFLMKFSSVSYHFLPVRSAYSPQESGY